MSPGVLKHCHGNEPFRILRGKIALFGVIGSRVIEFPGFARRAQRRFVPMWLGLHPVNGNSYSGRGVVEIAKETDSSC